MIVKTFSSIAQKYAATLGRNQKVRVVFQGTKGWTDGNVVNIPTLPAGTVMTLNEEKIYGGYLDHETGHVRWTDMAIFKQLKPTETLRHDILNLIEDVREEIENIEMYPGSKPGLNALALEVDTKSRAARGIRKQSSAELVLSLMYKELWAKCRDCNTQTIDGWLGDYPEWQPLEKILSKFPTVKDTTGSLRLTDEVIKFLGDRFPPPPMLQKVLVPGESEPGSGGGSGSQEGEPKEGKSKKSKGEGRKDLEVAAAQIAKEGDRTQAFVVLLQEIEESNQGFAGPPDQRGHSMKGIRGGSLALPPVTLANDRVMIPWVKTDRDAYLRERASLSPEITSVKRTVGIYLQTFANKAWSRGLEEGRLDSGALHTLMIGNTRVYKQLRLRRFMDTALLLVLDLSGSMNSQIVRKTAIVISEATMGVPRLRLQICGFTTNDLAKSSSFGGCRNKDTGLGRIDGVDIPIFKGFDEPYMKAQDKMGAIYVSNLTPLGDAYGYAFEAIVTRKEARRVIWIVSDGESYYSYQDPRHSDRVLMKNVHQKCRRFRVQTLGMGIGSHVELKEFVDGFSSIESPTDLPGAVLTGLKEILS